MPETLSDDRLKIELINNLKELKNSCEMMSIEQTAVVLGQWFHPLHYFPVFLSRLISVAPNLHAQTCISRILWEELGEGDSRRAHENIYLETMTDGGFERSQLAEAPPLKATQELVEGYETASLNYPSGLGFMYGTEVVDLPMVATIGELMRRSTGKRNLPWVNIHVAQEPGHVDSSNEALRSSLTAAEQQEVSRGAKEMWRLWINFFDSIRQEIVR